MNKARARRRFTQPRKSFIADLFRLENPRAEKYTRKAVNTYRKKNNHVVELWHSELEESWSQACFVCFRAQTPIWLEEK